MDVEKLKNDLRNGIVTIKFKKLNGDIREMNCTLNMNIIPTEFHPKGKINSNKESSVKTFRVFDVNANGWRSFVVDNIISV